MAEPSDHITDKIETIVAHQARVCAERTRGTENELMRLTQATDRLRDEVALLKVELATMRTAQAVAGVKHGIAAAIGASIPAVATAVFFILSR